MMGIFDFLFMDEETRAKRMADGDAAYAKMREVYDAPFVKFECRCGKAVTVGECMIRCTMTGAPTRREPWHYHECCSKECYQAMHEKAEKLLKERVRRQAALDAEMKKLALNRDALEVAVRSMADDLLLEKVRAHKAKRAGLA